MDNIELIIEAINKCTDAIDCAGFSICVWIFLSILFGKD